MIILLILVHSSYCPSQFQGSMTNCLYRFAVLFFSLVLFFSCKKEDIKQTSNDPTDSTQTGLVTGKVVSYDSNTASTQNWKVNSGLTDTVVMNDSYSVEVVEGDFGFQMVSDSNDREVLLGVTYPGQLDFTINLETTITAMLMCFPDVHWLNTEGRINLIGKIKSSPLLPEVSGLLRTDLMAGKSLFDVDSSRFLFFSKLSALYSQASAQRVAVGLSSVDIIRQGKTVLFQNPGKPFIQVIGVFRDGNKVATLELGRYKFFASNLGELVGSITHPAQPQEQTFQMSTDGNYEFRVRTGRPFAGISDEFSRKAFVSNGADFVMDNISPILRLVSFNNSCLEGVRNTAVEGVTNLTGALSENQGGIRQFSAALYSVAKTTVDFVKTSTDCMQKEKPGAKGFLGKAGKLMKWLEVVSLVLNDGNVAAQYFITPPAQDTCLKVTGNAVTLCKDSLRLNVIRDLSQPGYMLKATATGGVPPYKYQFLNSGYSAFSATPSATFSNVTGSQLYRLVYEGIPYIQVTDSEGSTRTVSWELVSDITITNFETFPWYAWKISWTSPLGLKPLGLRQVNGSLRFFGFLTGSTNPSDANRIQSLNTMCNDPTAAIIPMMDIITLSGTLENSSCTGGLSNQGATGTKKFRLATWADGGYSCTGTNRKMEVSREFVVSW